MNKLAELIWEHEKRLNRTLNNPAERALIDLANELEAENAQLTQAATIAAERSIDVAMDLVAKAAFEECAQIAERAISLEAYTDKRTIASRIAAAIRARSAEKGRE